MGISVPIKIQPLVVTPRPLPSESLKGLILRTSEANGYDNPSMMLGSAGMTHHQITSVIPPLEILAPMLNRSLDKMKKIGYWRGWENRAQKHITIFGHQLPSYYLSIQHPKICTQCIAESGCIDGFWDLKHAIACPIHNTVALDTCPECNKKLSWFRPGLLKCKCGFDLSNSRGKKVENQEILGLLSILRSKFLRQPLDENLLKDRLGFPVEHLEALSMGELISIIGRLENRIPHSNRRYSSRGDIPPKETVLENAAIALSHWPHGLNQYLRSFNNERVSTKGFGLRKQFESFYGSLFKSDIPHEKIAFIKEAFIKFGAEEWKQAYVSKTLDGGTGQGKQLVGIYGLASALGVMTSTARKIVMKEQIPSVTVTFNGRSRQLFDLDQALPFKASVGASFTVRKAAAWLSLPVSVLKTLRQQGDYEVQHIANPMAAYHELDLKAFQDKLLACRTVNPLNLSDEHITLKQVMLMKAGADAIKASFVYAILSGKLISIGNADEGINGMVFTRDEVEQFMVESKRQYLKLTTLVTAAKFLHSSSIVVKNLYRDGLLAGNQMPNGLFIREDSLAAFGAQYISCAAIASEHHTQSSCVIKRCQEKLINLHWFPRECNKTMQPFINRHDVAMLGQM